ncbi:GatB/YqeY domain-containing protein [bacterium]|nr:GatB/YqeY domain-containing protein [bacterium]
MIRDTIKSDVITALKAGEKEKASFLRVLVSEMQMLELTLKSQNKELTDDDALTVLKKEVKRRKEAIEIYTTAGESNKVLKEESEIAIISEYLPEQIGEDAIKEIVEHVISENPDADFGTIMKAVMAQTKGQADGNIVRNIVQTQLLT